MPSLRVVAGPGKGRSFVLGAEGVSIGRARENAIALDDSSVSFLHARVLRQGAAWVLEDLNSRNGTFVNARRVDAHTLAPGDRVRIGLNEMVFEEEAAPAHAPEAAPERPLVDSSVVLEDEESDRLLRIHWTHEDSSINRIAYDRTRDELATGRKHAGVLVDVTRKLSRVQELTDLLQELVNLLAETFRADRGFVMLFEKRGDQLHRNLVAVRHGGEARREPISRTLVDQVVSEKKPILSFDASKDARFSHIESVVDQKMHAVMCAPVLRGEKVLGVVHLDSDAATGLFGREELELLSVICDEAAFLIENAQLYSELRRMARYNASILRGLSEGLLAVDRAGMVTTLNLQAERILGLPSGEILFTRLSDHPWLAPLAALVERAFQGGSGPLRSELLLASPRGVAVRVEIAVSLLAPEREAPTEGSGAVVLLLDRGGAARGSERAARRAAALCAVEGLARELGSGGPEEAARTARLLRELAELGRPGPGRLDPVALEEVTERALTSQGGALAARGITVARALSPAPVRGSRDELVRAVAALLAGAVAAMPPGGKLVARSGTRAAGGEGGGAEEAWVEIEDSGPAPPPEALTRLLDPFEVRGDAAGALGAGAGLWVAEIVAARHDGRVEAEALPGQGLVARLVLPRRAGS